MIFRPDRTPHRSVARLGWRLQIFAVGAVLAGVGFYFEWSWMIWMAIMVLLIGMALRLLPTRSDEPELSPKEGPHSE